MRILALNDGSSSFKAALFEVDSEAPRQIWMRTGDPNIERTLGDVRGERIGAVGHRIVHGGRAFRETTRITPEVKTAIAAMAGLAPEHNRLEVEAIDEMERVLGPGIPQIAVFDTAFHATLPEEAYVYPGPYAWVERGIRRFGFHGISHQYVSRRAAEVLGRDLKSLCMVTCHLGGGCSLAALREGRSVDTTMGFTPLEGLMMGTRSGSVDPGILIHLGRHCGESAEALDRTLNHESGLKGVSGISGDMREIIAAMGQGSPRARLAFGIFVHRLCGGIAAMAASAGGLEALVFTAGIGENSAEVRAAVAGRLQWMGIAIDRARNEQASGEDHDIATADSHVRVLVVHTREESEIAREVWRLAGRGR